MKLNDKINGALFGMALGDALGLGTEFMTAAEAKTHYPEGLHNFSQIIRDAHRAQWRRGDWTNDTELMIVLIESVIRCGKVDFMDIVKEMKVWIDSNPADLVMLYRLIKKERDWEFRPKEVTAHIWRERNTDEASNEAIHRALIAGLLAKDKNEIIKLVKDLVLITHADSRCVSSTAVISLLIYDLFWNDRVTPIEELSDLAFSVDKRTVPYIEKACNSADISALALDDEDTFWYTRKAMASALWSLWHCSSPAEILDAIVAAGGDADTNASLSLAIGGMKYGYDALPEIVNDLVQYDRMKDISVRLTDFMAKEAGRRGVTFS